MLNVTKFLMCSVHLNVVTTSGTTHIKTLFSFSPGTGRHFTGNALCNSADCYANHSHSALLRDKQSHVQTLDEKSRGVKSEERGSQGMGPYSTIRKFSVQKGTNTTGEVGRSSNIVLGHRTAWQPCCRKTLPVSSRRLSRRVIGLQIGAVWFGYI
jgi:hypothetical protein